MLTSLFCQFEKIVVFDIETTGLNFKTDEIIELGAIQVTASSHTYNAEMQLNTLFKLSEGRQLSQEISGLTGITQQQLEQDGIPKAEGCKQLVELLDNQNTLLAAYNAQFDLNFIYHFLNAYKSADVLKQLKLLDVMAIYKDRRDYPHKLSDAVESYSLRNENAHRAVDDAKATLDLLSAMGSEKDDLVKYINLFGYNPKYGISGSKISSVTYKPQGYDRKKPLYEM